MPGFIDNIEQLTLENTLYRQVLFTSQHLQLVVMSIPPQGEIGLETHDFTDQFLRIEKGTGVAILNGEKKEVGDGSALVVPAGTEHNVINTSDSEPLQLSTLYSPPHHRPGVKHGTKEEADHDEDDHL
ncbi:cupin domain-containing protein [Candidatus Woesebacteria bacterium]|nr:cupin domain-containing protein [Candidatus Woesebacteria bacterium]MCD8527196.1 cupin domain-containing protein [Candidatus Woesebacteria bacterium]MCD8546561.1 cupin domain-containing protein [Candidatus Woesebacteria bacterium]